MNREQWLEEAVKKIHPLLSPAQHVFGERDIPAVKISVGWPSKGGTSTRNRVVGQCWKKDVSKDGYPQIFISPTVGDDLLQALGVVVHELIHAWDDCQSGHKGNFARAARAVGLEGKLTATHVDPGSPLGLQLTQVIEELGTFPHGPLDVAAMQAQRPKQTTRMIKLHSPNCCSYTVRTTQKWIDEGLPLCPHGEEMEVAE